MTTEPSKTPLEDIATLDYMREEYLRFRELLCSKNVSRKKKEDGYRALTLVWFNMNEADSKAFLPIWKALHHSGELYTRLEAST